MSQKWAKSNFELVPTVGRYLGKAAAIKLLTQAAQAHYVWVRASEVMWSEYTRIISLLSDAK